MEHRKILVHIDTTARDRLILCFCLALVVTVLSVGWFQWSKQVPMIISHAQQMEVTFSEQTQADAPNETQLMAQRDQKGEDIKQPVDPVKETQEQPLLPDISPHPKAVPVVQEVEQRGPEQQEEALKEEGVPEAAPTKRTPTLLSPGASELVERTSVDAPADQEKEGNASKEAMSAEKRPGELADQVTAPMPLRRYTIMASAKKSMDADYLLNWRQRVEFLGNRLYPPFAEKTKLSGRLRLLVAINADGSLRKVQVRRSSGSKALDSFALDIVKRAAPFPPLPAAMRQNIDVLEIIRTWQFRHGTLAERP